MGYNVVFPGTNSEIWTIQCDDKEDAVSGRCHEPSRKVESSRSDLDDVVVDVTSSLALDVVEINDITYVVENDVEVE